MFSEKKKRSVSRQIVEDQVIYQFKLNVPSTILCHVSQVRQLVIRANRGLFENLLKY